jgi:hypothetical protein
MAFRVHGGVKEFLASIGACTMWGGVVAFSHAHHPATQKCGLASVGVPAGLRGDERASLRIAIARAISSITTLLQEQVV